MALGPWRRQPWPRAWPTRHGTGGGDRIISLDSRPEFVDACTGGFPAENGSGRYMITPARCQRDANRTVWNGQQHEMGTFSTAIDRGLDAAYVRAPTAR